MSQSTLNVCMYTPTSHGGHALYAQELLNAIAEVGPSRCVAAGLVTCEDDSQRPVTAKACRSSASYPARYLEEDVSPVETAGTKWLPRPACIHSTLGWAAGATSA